MEQEKLIEAVESIRRDKHQPWRYILFTFLNGMAQGLGMALGMTIILGLVIYIVTLMLAKMVNFPVVGQYFQEITTLIDLWVKQARVR